MIDTRRMLATFALVILATLTAFMIFISILANGNFITTNSVSGSPPISTVVPIP
jgi:hypothetical protein